MVKYGDASTSEYFSFEYSFVTITLHSKRRLVLLCVYRKQEVSFLVFQEEFTTFMDKALNQGEVLLVVGDFNVWMEVANDPDTIRLGTLMNACGLTQVVHEPTHREGHTLDHIYVNEYQMEIEHSVIPETLGLTTDHFPLTIKIPSPKVHEETRLISFRRLKDIDLDKFKLDLGESFKSIDFSNSDFRHMTYVLAI